MTSQRPVRFCFLRFTAGSSNPPHVFFTTKSESWGFRWRPPQQPAMGLPCLPGMIIPTVATVLGWCHFTFNGKEIVLAKRSSPVAQHPIHSLFTWGHFTHRFKVGPGWKGPLLIPRDPRLHFIGEEHGLPDGKVVWLTPAASECERWDLNPGLLAPGRCRPLHATRLCACLRYLNVRSQGDRETTNLLHLRTLSAERSGAEPC